MAAGGEDELFGLDTIKEAIDGYHMRELVRYRFRLTEQEHRKEKDQFPFFLWGKDELHHKHFNENFQPIGIRIDLPFISKENLEFLIKRYVFPLVKLDMLDQSHFDHILALLENNGRYVEPDESYTIMQEISDIVENRILTQVDPFLARGGSLPREIIILREFYYLKVNNLDLMYWMDEDSYEDPEASAV